MCMLSISGMMMTLTLSPGARSQQSLELGLSDTLNLCFLFLRQIFR